MSKSEYLFRRDHSYSLWRRTLSNHWYATDIDETMFAIYNNQCKVIALLEEKNSALKELDLNSCQFEALRDLAGTRPLFALLSYKNEEQNYHTFYVVAANKAAQRLLKKAIGTDRRYLSELDYVRFESYLRKEKAPINDRACILVDKFTLPNIKEWQPKET